MRKLLQPVVLELTAEIIGAAGPRVSEQASGRNEGRQRELDDMSILWTILIGFVAGILAKLIHPGPNEPSGFILTTLLGIAGAFVATYLGQAVGWYRPDEAAGFIGATVGALIVLFVWGMFARRTPA
jgi:uncharacterized membrane protein YeaQ/YmgE (transglycosylase-associated protein family)